MIDGFSFLQQELMIPIFLGGLLVFVAFVFKEWKTRNKGRLVVNTIVALVTVLALVFIVLKPTKEVEMQNRQGLLLTEGFNEKQKDSLEAVFKGIQPVEYNSKKSVLKALDSLTSVIIVGNGVEEYDFHAFDSIPTTYIPNEIPSGITLLNFTNQLVLGDEYRVTGMYSKPKLSTQLVLQDSRGNGLDSIPFKEEVNHHFSLKTIPKASGNFVYQIAEKDSVGNLLASNPLPITIREKEPVSILIIYNFPTFETKYLKNFLADAGYEVTVRSQLTKDKYKFEYFNTKASPVYQFTEESLNQFDVVITDTETYFNFVKSVKSHFENSIRENGLGLFIQPSELLFNFDANTSYFSFERDGINEIKLPNTNITVEKNPFRFNEAFALNSINADESGNLSYYKQLGLGRVATTTLLNSYQLLLKGEEQAYARIWTQILDKIVKQKALAVEWQSQTELPKIGAPFNFELRTGLEELSVKNTEGNRVPLLQNSTVLFKYSGTTYPKKRGWNRLEIETDSTLQFSYYVYDANDWKTLIVSKNIVSNAKQFGIDIKKNRTVVENRPISVLLFYILFLIGMGWLWLSPKLSAEG
ncbi:hypothetical protein [Maribacter hydrothermalis]|uniref:Uncharacterized protein n=1 Tax=Maribacter hydrothermalis TaxID=1836467 RepID=A0A1B7YZ06_9FLAO|nr:hypothetical protein [Maribacter hydrothermalis]APQ16111.1 hypothetical protein BTR34_01560 [Maribacter hydrothermalis]OBR35712.1 hypothetical protein A9200_10955 [Maribacter hydrothermalis]